MVELKFYKILIICLLFLISCDFFNTRDPESPDISNSQFLPQTSADYVIKNFVKALSERNTEYYTNCFIDSNYFQNINYSFYPAIESKVSYPSAFDNWNISSEKQFIQILKNKYSTTKKIKFLLTNAISDFHVDSIIFNYDYYFEFESEISFAPQKYSGLMQLTIAKNSTGQWAISRWSDFAKKNDPIENTLSILKGKLSN